MVAERRMVRQSDCKCISQGERECAMAVKVENCCSSNESLGLIIVISIFDSEPGAVPTLT